MYNQGDHQRLPTVMTNIFPLSEAQNNVSIRVNYFWIILKVTGHERGSISNILNRQSNFSFIINSHHCCVGDRKRQITLTTNIYPLSENCVVFLFIGTLRHICVHQRPLSFISQHSNPCVDHQKLLCKICSRLILWKPLVNRRLFHWYMNQSG